MIPPVGMNLVFGKGPAIASKKSVPPKSSAGKSFRTSKSNCMAAEISVGVATPGTTATSRLLQYSTISLSKPGITMNLAPHAMASCACATLVTVPAPAKTSGQCALSSLMAFGAASVR